MVSQVRTVKMGEIETAECPGILRAILGSCIGLALYDPHLKIGGLAHIFLPLSREGEEEDTRYADIAVPTLVERLLLLNCKKVRLICHMTGGGEMFPVSNNSLITGGRKNIEITRKMLEKMAIPVTREDVGGNFGSEIILYTENGKVEIKRERYRVSQAIEVLPREEILKRAEVFTDEEQKDLGNLENWLEGKSVVLKLFLSAEDSTADIRRINRLYLDLIKHYANIYRIDPMVCRRAYLNVLDRLKG